MLEPEQNVKRCKLAYDLPDEGDFFVERLMRKKKIYDGSIVQSPHYHLCLTEFDGPAGRWEYALCLGINKAAMGSFLAEPEVYLVNCGMDVGGGDGVTCCCELTALSFEGVEDFPDGSVADLDGEGAFNGIARGLMGLECMPGNIEGP